MNETRSYRNIVKDRRQVLKWLWWSVRGKKTLPDYVSRAHYVTARHVARVHQHSIEPIQCDLCEFKTICKSNMKRHHERMHNIKSESESELRVKSELELSIVALN